MKYSFGQFSLEHLQKMREGIELYNEQKYWECHEAFEDLWMEDRGDPARDVYWAIIQVAASCIHVRNANIIGAQGMLNKSKEKFKRCRDQNTLTQLAFDYLDWEELEKLVFKIPEQGSKLEDYKDLYNFRFKHFPDT